MDSSKETPDWDDSLQPSLYGSFALFLFLGNVSVALRLLSQWKQIQSFHVDDYLAIIALILSNLLVANFIVATNYGLGLHISRLATENPYNLIVLFKYTWIDSVFVGPTFLAIRLSLLFFYKRLLIVHQRWLKVFWYGNVIYNVLWFIASTGYAIFQCWPVTFYWERYYSRFHLSAPYPIAGQCNASSPVDVGLVYIFGLFADVALLVIPIGTLGGLHRSWRERVALLAVFCVGLLACVMELVRIIITMVGTDAAKDPTYGEVTLIILTAGTAHVGVMCACLPTIWILFRAQLRRWRPTSGGTFGHGVAGDPSGTNTFRLKKTANMAPSPSYLQNSGFRRLSDDGLLPIQQANASEAGGSSEDTKPGQIMVRTDIEWSTSSRL